MLNFRFLTFFVFIFVLAIMIVSSASPPTLLITGTGDEVVDPGNSARLGARLREKGVPVREIVYPGLGHSTLVGALAAPLRGLAPVLADVALFINEVSLDHQITVIGPIP